MNENRIVTDHFSNPDSKQRYRNQWSDEPELVAQYEEGGQCGGCAYFAPFNSDWGLCCNALSRHLTETVFEHFTCSALVDEGWGAHSFSGSRRAGRDNTGVVETAPNPTVEVKPERVPPLAEHRQLDRLGVSRTEGARMTREVLEAQLLRLPSEERAYLARALIESLDNQPELDGVWLDEARRRAAELSAGTVQGTSAATAFAQARTRLAR